MESEKGLFIPKTALPDNYWRSFLHIAQANGLSPKELICKMIVSEVNELQSLREPLLGQIFKKVGSLLEKKTTSQNL